MEVGQIYYHQDEGRSLVAGSYKSCISAYSLENDNRLFYQNKSAKPEKPRKVNYDYELVIMSCKGHIPMWHNIFYFDGYEMQKGFSLDYDDNTIKLLENEIVLSVSRDKCFWIQWL